MNSEWTKGLIRDYLQLSNGQSRPEEGGHLNVYGSNGVIGSCREENSPANTIIIGRVGTYCGSVHYSSYKCWVTDNAIKVVPKNGYSSRFFYYLLKKYDLGRLRTGSGQPLLNQTILNNIEVNIPSYDEQKAIAHILGTLDDKIELNRQMNKTLEAMAQALFKSWFVDFDPVIDNVLAAGNDIHDELKARAAARQALGDQRKPLPPEIQRQFPDKFVLSDEMGWIPEGWNFQSVYDVAKFVNGSAFKSKDFSSEKSGLPIIKIAEIKNGISGQTKFSTQKFEAKYLLSNGDLLFSWSGNPDTSIDTFIWGNGEGWLNQHIFKVLPATDHYSYVYSLLKFLKPEFTRIAGDKQTTGLGHVTIGDLKKLLITKSPASLLKTFDSNAGSMLDKWLDNFLGTRQLVVLRDTLLPKLMSGELRVPEVEKLVEEAV